MDHDYSNPQDVGCDAFAALASKKKSGVGIAGGCFAYPPPRLVNAFTDQVSIVGLEPDSEVVLLLNAGHAASVAMKWRLVGEVTVKPFCSKSSRSMFHKNYGTDMSLVSVASGSKTVPTSPYVPPRKKFKSSKKF